MRTYGSRFAVLVTTVLFVSWVPSAGAYPAYSDGNGGSCAACHGSFESGGYTPPSGGASWGIDLMTGHLGVIPQGFPNGCDVCHTGVGTFSSVSTFSSNGVGGQFTQSCLGCHGRVEPGLVGSTESSGLRQRHFRAGVTECATCHNLDSDPAVYTPESEDSLPPYYDLDLSVVTLTDPCNAGGVGEDFAGDSAGLDNDGDLIYDALDPDCATPTPTPTPATPTPATPTPATPTPATPTPTPLPAADCLCVPTRVSPGGTIAAFGNVSDNGSGKGSSLRRTISVALKGKHDEPGRCASGAMSNPVEVHVELVDDDGDKILDASQSGVVCSSGATTYVKFTVEVEVPKNCKGSVVPRTLSRGDIHLTATTVDGSLEVTRSILCKRDFGSDD